MNAKRFWPVAAGAGMIVAGWFAFVAIMGVANPFYAVSSESMVPTLNVGDVVVLKKGPQSSFNDLKIGDIIVFHSTDGGGRTIVHRIMQIYDDGEERIVRTKGDNNPVSYDGLDYPIREGDYYGKVAYVIPKLGIGQNSGVMFVAVMVAAIFVIVAAALYWKETKRRNKVEGV